MKPTEDNLGVLLRDGLIGLGNRIQGGLLELADAIRGYSDTIAEIESRALKEAIAEVEIPETPKRCERED